MDIFNWWKQISPAWRMTLPLEVKGWTDTNKLKYDSQEAQLDVDKGTLQEIISLKKIRWVLKDVESTSALAPLTALEYLDTDSSKLHDLQGIENLFNLQRVRVPRTSVADLSPLSGLIHLRSLHLGCTAVKSLAPLAGLTELESVAAWGTQITDLAPLHALPCLRSLDIMNVPVTDWTQLSGLKSLTILSIAENNITDLTPLSSLKNLEELDLCGNPVEDLSPLYELPALAMVACQRTKIGHEQREAFARVRPEVYVYYDEGHCCGG